MREVNGSFRSQSGMLRRNHSNLSRGSRNRSNSRGNFNPNSSGTQKDNPLQRPLNFNSNNNHSNINNGESSEDIAFTKNLLFKKDENLLQYDKKYSSRRDENKRKMLTLNSRNNRSHSNVKINFNNTTNFSKTQESTIQQRKKPPVVANKVSIPHQQKHSIKERRCNTSSDVTRMHKTSEQFANHNYQSRQYFNFFFKVLKIMEIL